MTATNPAIEPCEALQFNGTNCIECLVFMDCPHWDNLELQGTDNPVVHSPFGKVAAEKGDWIIKRKDGAFELAVGARGMPPFDKILKRARQLLKAPKPPQNWDLTS